MPIKHGGALLAMRYADEAVIVTNPEVSSVRDSDRIIGMLDSMTTHAKLLNFFEGQKGVSFDLLKTVNQFVDGYEVAACPMKLWEDAILQGYSVFRQVRANGGGIIIGNRGSRRVMYKPLQEKS